MDTSKKKKNQTQKIQLPNELIEDFFFITFKLVENLLVVRLFTEQVSHMKANQRENRCTFLVICHFIISSQSRLLSQ